MLNFALMFMLLFELPVTRPVVGVVFIDSNADGHNQVMEQRIVGASVHVTNGTDTQVYITNQDGHFHGQMAAEEVEITVILPCGDVMVTQSYTEKEKIDVSAAMCSVFVPMASSSGID